VRGFVTIHSLARCAVLFKIFCVKHGFDLLKEDFYKLSL